ncbi:conserved hypothetical protein [Ktedonobacter racemifer DSM 44963]|uniref:Uncharacterized protein n=1 Tax=Ktedonobacter racemifer DSM 44963 TaxID=485913 RepID=D6TGI8_KTERA|nr:conserved hypothetical protein [Ktedonobacter racemifer DSM 44963]
MGSGRMPAPHAHIYLLLLKTRRHNALMIYYPLNVQIYTLFLSYFHLTQVA